MPSTDRPNRFGAAASNRKAPEPTPGSVPEKPVKYTVLLAPQISTELTLDVMEVSRRAGRVIDKSEVLRVLIDLLHTDPSLLDQVSRRFGQR